MHPSIRNFAALIVAGWLLMDQRAIARTAVPAPDYYQVTTSAPYRPVSVPGTQRRVAQNDAEDKARRLIYEHIGSLPVSGRGTVNDIMSRDARVKAKLLEMIRNAELVDWNVLPQHSCVTVCMRIDQNRVRSFLAACGYQ